MKPKKKHNRKTHSLKSGHTETPLAQCARFVLDKHKPMTPTRKALVEEILGYDNRKSHG